MPSVSLRLRLVGGAVLLAGAAACGGDSSTAPIAPGFLGGTSDNHQVGVVVNALGKSVTLFQLGNPARQAGLGDMQRAAGSREPAAVHHLGKEEHVVEVLHESSCQWNSETRFCCLIV